jgi:hypothetical protein
MARTPSDCDGDFAVLVGSLMVDYGLPGVISLMIGLLVAQIIAVYFWGVEPARRPLEGLDPKV